MSKRIKVGKKYTPAQVKAMREDPELSNLIFQGYIWRANQDGTMQLLPWHQATGAGGRGPRQYVMQNDDPWGELPVIRKRTPQERVDSLASRIKEDLLAGRVFTAEQIRQIDTSWKMGDPIPGEIVRMAAAQYLGLAEVEAEKVRRKKVADYRPS